MKKETINSFETKIIDRLIQKVNSYYLGIGTSITDKVLQNI